MYGMVNQGVQSFITKNFGQADWLDICDRAGVSDTQFEGMLTYPDEVTYKLVGAICEKYDMSAEDALENFGAYWIDFSRTTSVGKLIRFGGQELADLLDSLTICIPVSSVACHTCNHRISNSKNTKMAHIICTIPAIGKVWSTW